jgi:autotransporter-associated beta strand protein
MQSAGFRRVFAAKLRMAFGVIALSVCGVLHGADGVWTNATGGVWSGPTNWLDGVVADGMDSTAFFTNVNLTASIPVTLEEPVTVGTIHASDPFPASPGWWDIVNSSSTTNWMQVTNVVVGSFAPDYGVALYVRLTGDNPLVKSGAGRLVLVSDNDFTGGTTVGEGSLQVGNSDTTGSIGTGAVHVAGGAALIYQKSGSGTVSVPHGAGIAGDGNLSVTAGKIALEGDTAIGGALTFTQNSGAVYGNGIDLKTDVTLTASAFSLSGDIGQHNTAQREMTLDTSEANGPVNLDISLGRSGIWYPFKSFTVNAGTGPINFSGGRLGAGGAGFRQTPATLTGAVNMPVNLHTERPFTVNAAADGRISGVIYGSGGSLVKTGPGTLTVSGRNTYTGPTIVNEGILALGQPAVTGAARHFDASNLGLANGTAVSQWNDLSGGGHHATVPTSDSNVAPTYIADAGTGTGLGALNFLRNTGAATSSALRFTRDSAIRSVFSIFKGKSFLLTDNTSTGQTYHFHRPNNTDSTAPLWHGSHTSANIRNGQTYINGVLTNGVTYAMPTAHHNGYNLVEIITTGNVTADSFNKDRYTIHAGDQSHGEMIIFDRALSESERLQTEAYLMKKWFGIGDGAGDTLPTSTELILEGDSVLDMSGIQRQTVGSIQTSADTEIRLHDAALSVSGDGQISGAISGDGALVKRGAGTLSLQGAAGYSGATIVTGGVLQVVNVDVPDTNPVAGATRWFDASALALTNGAPVTQWNDLSGNNAHAVNATGTRIPVYATNAVSGLGAIFFDRVGGNDSGHFLRFTRESGIRTVFSVFKGAGFLLTDDSSHHFHRGGTITENPADPIWYNTPGALAKNETTYVNGRVVGNGIADPMPTIYNNGFNLVEVVSDVNLQANTFNRDRTYHSGKQYQGEVILYNRKLSEAERLAVERYLLKKWFGHRFSGALPNAPVVLGGGATLDPGGTSATLGTLTLVGNATIALGDGSGSLSFADSSAVSWSGALALTGTLGAQSLRFGTGSSGLTRAQLDRITWNGAEVSLDGGGYLIKRIPGTLLMIN